VNFNNLEMLNYRQRTMQHPTTSTSKRRQENEQMVEEPHLGATDAGRVALEPGEVAAGVDVQEVWPRRAADAHGHVVQAARGNSQAQTPKKSIFFFLAAT
jgi:hypothetical protein